MVSSARCPTLVRRTSLRGCAPPPLQGRCHPSIWRIACADCRLVVAATYEVGSCTRCYVGGQPLIVCSSKGGVSGFKPLGFRQSGAYNSTSISPPNRLQMATMELPEWVDIFEDCEVQGAPSL